MRLLLVIAGLTAVLASCSDDDDEGGGDTGSADSGGDTGGGPIAANCADRCSTKAIDCEAPADLAAELCDEICAQQPTEAQAQCLESSDCQTLALGLQNGSICGIGEDTAECGNGVCDPGEELSNCPSDCNVNFGGDYGDPCDCGEPTTECTGTENGCRFSLDQADDPLWCFVNSDTVSTGFCTRSCDPDNDDCPGGTVCTPFQPRFDPGTGDSYYRCN